MSDLVFVWLLLIKDTLATRTTLERVAVWLSPARVVGVLSSTSVLVAVADLHMDVIPVLSSALARVAVLEAPASSTISVTIMSAEERVNARLLPAMLTSVSTTTLPRVPVRLSPDRVILASREASALVAVADLLSILTTVEILALLLVPVALLPDRVIFVSSSALERVTV